MTRQEAIKLLNCSYSELAEKLGITTAAVARWGDDVHIPSFREYQIRELATGRKPLGIKEPKQNVAHANN
ncbi:MULTISPECIES: ribonuclease D [Acinetobacter]|uniref:Ribonuclease D n=1 Tax=Acinetobacter piscicola TaxID=2006115 RepID=A0A7S6VYI8_9GAMM|nr:MULTISPECIES: ribonuclease D [Acinetobacter]QOW47259.1 ribonuclease D [Acinetobacter piscicola]QUS49535.1 ribonuclease D [Acinetobacter junii]